MKITAIIRNLEDQHHITLTTNGKPNAITIAPKSNGFGSSVNGAELLCLALATCYCNDLYREAAKRNIRVAEVQVEVESDFGAEGEPARRLSYNAKVTAHASDEEIRDLMRQTDRVTEIQNTVRSGVMVNLVKIEPVSL